VLRALIIPTLLFCLSGFAQERITAANALAKSLAAAVTDPERDALNTSLKQELKALMEQDDAPSLSLNELQLSKVEAPDGTFRLITWNVPRENGTHLYEGLLLHADGRKRALYELRDMTREITSPEVPELGPDRWYGALYYQVVPVKRGGKTYYTLLGWKGYDKVETRKVVDVLHFKGSQPRFGAPIFGPGKLKRTRQVYGYSFQATMTLRYEPDRGIVMDHLSPARQDLQGQWAFYGPDMSYDALVWEKDHWRLERDIDARDRQRSDKPFNAPPPAPRP
jgi:hypothetical protein